MTEYKLTWFELINLMGEFCRKLGEEHDEMPIEDFEEWSDNNYEEAREAGKAYLKAYGEEASTKEKGLFEEYDLTVEQMRHGLEWKVADINCDKGRPSKVDKWEEMIIDGAATLEEARDHMSDPTWYKLQERILNYRSDEL